MHILGPNTFSLHEDDNTVPTVTSGYIRNNGEERKLKFNPFFQFLSRFHRSMNPHSHDQTTDDSIRRIKMEIKSLVETFLGQILQDKIYRTNLATKIPERTLGFLQNLLRTSKRHDLSYFILDM